MMKIRTFLMAGLLLFTFSGFASCSGDVPTPDTEETVTPEMPEQPDDDDTPNYPENEDKPDAPGQDEPGEPGHNEEDNNNDYLMSNQLKITVGTVSFFVILADNATAAAFKALLPLSLKMSEMNGNEKYSYLSESLPTAPSNPGTIRAGDLMLYGSSCVVLFYEGFRTSYSYTRIGRVDNTSGLADALGRGGVTVNFEVNKMNN